MRMETITEQVLDYKELGKRIANFRKEAGISQKQLSEALSISQQLVANYELGQRRIHVALLIKLSKVLNKSVDEILGIENYKTKPGPPSLIQKRLEQVQRLTTSKQKMVLEFLDSFLKNELKKE
jgi:transcriptional regulator with XRE-family HTH domain